MTDTSNSADAQASEKLIEVRGCMSRTEWELMYLAASQFAQSHGLSISRFDLQSAATDGQGQGVDASPIAVCVPDRTPGV